MLVGTTQRLLFLSIVASSLALLLGNESRGQESARPIVDQSIEMHSHQPIDIDARPIVSRFKVSLIRPRRLLMLDDETMVVADWGAGTIIRVSSDGKTSLLAEELNEPSGLARDSLGNLYVSIHEQGMTNSGTVVKISSDGMQSVFAEGLTGPTALAVDEQDYVFVANYHGNNIARISPMGEVTTFVENIPTPGALVFSREGTLFATSSTEGTLYAISPMGDVEVLARGLDIPSDLAIDPQGHLIVTNFGGTELSYIDRKGRSTIFASVPKGTIGAQFDSVGNVLLLNWDLQLLMKVTSHLTVPCPHCRQPIPIRLRPKKKPTPKPKEKPTGPFI